MVSAGDGPAGHAFSAQAPTTSTCVCGTGEDTGTAFAYADFGPVSGGGSGTPMHTGDFDNTYYTGDGAPGSVAGFMRPTPRLPASTSHHSDIPMTPVTSAPLSVAR